MDPGGGGLRRTGERNAAQADSVRADYLGRVEGTSPEYACHEACFNSRSATGRGKSVTLSALKQLKGDRLMYYTLYYHDDDKPQPISEEDALR